MSLEADYDVTRREQVQDALESGAIRSAARMLQALKPGEIAHVLEALPHMQRQFLWGMIDNEDTGDVLMELADEVRADLINNMEKDEVLALSEGMDSDDLVDLLQELPDTITVEILESLDKQYRERIETVLSYPEDTAGGLMDSDAVTVRPEVTLDVVMRYLRLLKEELPSHLDSLMVVNREGQYLGVLFLTKLVTHCLDETVAEVMSLDVEPIPAHWEDKQVAYRFEQHDLVSAAVVDDDGQLLGRITADDVMDFIREEGEHHYMGQAGLSEDEDMFAPVFVSARRRSLWLGVNLMTAFLASWVIGWYTATLEQVVALAILMPIVASMGGVAGTQTLTLTIRGLALNQLSSKNTRWLLYKELAVAALNSLVWAVVVAVIAGFWFDNASIAGLIATALTINLLVAAITGALLPIGLEKLGIDPALAGGVLLTTVTDIVGFMSFLGLASYFLV